MLNAQSLLALTRCTLPVSVSLGSEGFKLLGLLSIANRLIGLIELNWAYGILRSCVLNSYILNIGPALTKRILRTTLEYTEDYIT